MLSLPETDVVENSLSLAYTDNFFSTQFWGAGGRNAAARASWFSLILKRRMNDREMAFRNPKKYLT